MQKFTVNSISEKKTLALYLVIIFCHIVLGIQ